MEHDSAKSQSRLMDVLFDLSHKLRCDTLVTISASYPIACAERSYSTTETVMHSQYSGGRNMRLSHTNREDTAPGVIDARATQT